MGKHARLILALAAICAVSIGTASARNKGQDWAKINPDPAVREWFKKQMMPDAPDTSCCGEADAYYVDSYEQKDGRFYAIITDDRDDEPLQRMHAPIGTRVEIPANKFNKTPLGNPTGHGIVFMRWYYGAWNVLCYLMPGGV